jgi:hypothetical protein
VRSLSQRTAGAIEAMTVMFAQKSVPVTRISLPGFTTGVSVPTVGLMAGPYEPVSWSWTGVGGSSARTAETGPMRTRPMTAAATTALRMNLTVTRGFIDT